MKFVMFLRYFVPQALKEFLVPYIYGKNYSLPSVPKVIAFLMADYGNIGDLAIAHALKEFVLKEKKDFRFEPIPISITRQVIRSIRNQVSDEDIIAITGGGNMGSLYPDIERLRQYVIKSFPKNRIICFPQTLDWNDTDLSARALENIKKIYSNHSDLYLFARESLSFAKMQKLFAGHQSVKVALAPDIVLSTTAARLGAQQQMVSERVILCLRDDNERSLGPREVATLRQVLGRIGLELEDTDTHVGGVGLTPEHCRRLVTEKLEQFQAARLVVTDRLHGMILAVLSGTPCLVLPNTNHKILQTWLDWLTNVPQVRFLPLSRVEVVEVDLTIRQLLAVPREIPAVPAVAPKHFDSLRMALEV